MQKSLNTLTIITKNKSFYERKNKMRKLLCIALALIMCTGAMSFSLLSVSAAEENLLANASYAYEAGDFFNSFTDYAATLLTDGHYRGDGTVAWDDIYAVEGATVELVGTNADNIIVFSLENEIFLDYLYFRGFRRIGNRYSNIASIEVSANGESYTSLNFIETATAIKDAPEFIEYNGAAGVDQYFDVKASFDERIAHVKYIRVTINTYSPSGRKYICQLDEVEAYGSKTSKYPSTAELSLTTDKESVDIGEAFTVTVLFNNITTENGIVGCDLPLIYDNTKLSLTKVEGIFPTAWGKTGTVINPGAAGSPYWLRAFCDADDLADKSAYNVTADGVFGFKLTFRAVASGTAEIKIDNDVENDVYLFVVNGADFDNYGATGASTEVTVTENTIDVTVGDVNLDGSVDNLDAAIILRYDAGIIELDDATLARGDYNGDGEVDNIDAAAILRYDAGL